MAVSPSAPCRVSSYPMRGARSCRYSAVLLSGKGANPMADAVSERTTSKKKRTSAPQPSAIDLYNIDSLLTEDERLVRDTVRTFVRERVLPIIGEHFEAGTFPRDLIPEIAELGL